MKILLFIQFTFLLSESAQSGPYLIKSPNTKCIRTQSLSNNGANVEVWDCSGVDQQNWFYDPSTKLLRVGSTSGKCLSVVNADYGNWINGASIVTHTCLGYPNQEFDIIGQSIISENVNTGAIKCLDVHGPDANKNGGEIQLWDCNGNSNQQWSLEKSDCYEVDLTRVAILKTKDQVVNNMENWDLTDKAFSITLYTKFGSHTWPQWSGCTYRYSGAYVDSQDQPCVVPTGNHNPGYDCFMKDFPKIYLTESQMNAGLAVEVYGEIGDANDFVTWDYEFTFTEWNANDVKTNGVKESYATRNSPGGRRGRHFYKYTYTDNSNCNFNINEYFDCE